MRVMVSLKRVYDPPAKADGLRVLVDRLWPRGLRREAAAIDEWAKDVAPSRELRVWYGHDAERLSEFRVRYRQELRQAKAAEALERLRARAGRGRLTLLTATRDLALSHAEVLRA